MVTINIAKASKNFPKFKLLNFSKTASSNENLIRDIEAQQLNKSITPQLQNAKNSEKLTLFNLSRSAPSAWLYIHISYL